MNSILDDLQRRKRNKENPCDRCNGSGFEMISAGDANLACSRCLGEGVDLTEDERHFLMEKVFTGSDYDDEILNASELT